MKKIYIFNNSLYSLVISLLVFQLKYGLDKLIPTNINWLLKVKHDWGQHYLGWAFYRKEEWHFPLGKIENLYHLISTNIGFTDSIPLFAIPFKILSPILPDEFQYFGIWLFLCFFLTAFFSFKLLRKYDFNLLQLLLIVLLITSNPVLLYRGMHPALCSQWLIIGSIYLYLKSENKKNYIKINLQQYILLLISSLIHPYITFIILGFIFVLVIKHFFYTKVLKKEYLIIFPFLSIISIIISWYLVGYISFSETIDSQIKGGFGLYSMNLNSFYNSFGYSNIIASQPLTNPMQYEGYMYLGFGLISLIIITATLGFKYLKRLNKHHFLFPLFIFSFLTFLFAVTNKITFNDKTILEFSIPSFIEKFGNIFRASSRFFWVNYYIILFLIFIVFSKLKLKNNLKSILLLLIIGLQFYDLTNFFNNYNYKIGSYTSDLNQKKWDSLLVNIKHIKTYPPYNFTGLGKPYEYQELAYIAERNNSTFTNAYVARIKNSKEKLYTKNLIKDLSTASIKTDEVIITSKEHLDKTLISVKDYSSKISYLDGYYILHSSKTKQIIENVKGQRSIDSLYRSLLQKSFKILNNEKIRYGKLKYNVEKLDITTQYIDVSGWAFIENSNDIRKDSVFIGLLKNDTVYIAKLNKLIRKDVTNHFKSINLDNSGYNGINWFNRLPKGKYKVALVIRREDNFNIIQPLDKFVNVTKKKYFIPEPYNIIYKNSNNLKFNLETINSNNELINISGWSFVENKNSNNSKIYLLLKKNQQILKIPTELVMRNDVNKHFKSDYNYSYSGFNTKFKKSLLRGKYTVGILIVDTKNKKKTILFSNKSIDL